ncbi:MAG: hypothetical protein WCG93_02710 [Paludibacter sp.]
MEIIQNTHSTFKPNVTAYYKTIQNSPNVLNFNQLLTKFDDLKIFHNPSYFNLLNKWETGALSQPPFVFGLESGAFFSATSIFFLYTKNDKQIMKKLPYKYMSLYLGNKDSKFTHFLESQFTVADWTVISDFSNYCTNKYTTRKAKEAQRKEQLLETLLEFKSTLSVRMPILEFDQLFDKHDNFNLFEADTNWERFHWYRKANATYKNGKTPYTPILFGTESGLMFCKTAFICNYGIDKGENETKRYYQKIDYRNINHPEFENIVGKFLNGNDLELLKELGKMMKVK